MFKMKGSHLYGKTIKQSGRVPSPFKVKTGGGGGKEEIKWGPEKLISDVTTPKEGGGTKTKKTYETTGTSPGAKVEKRATTPEEIAKYKKYKEDVKSGKVKRNTKYDPKTHVKGREEVSETDPKVKTTKKKTEEKRDKYGWTPSEKEEYLAFNKKMEESRKKEVEYKKTDEYKAKQKKKEEDLQKWKEDEFKKEKERKKTRRKRKIRKVLTAPGRAIRNMSDKMAVERGKKRTQKRLSKRLNLCDITGAGKKPKGCKL